MAASPRIAPPLPHAMAPKLRAAPKRAAAKTVARPSGKAKAKAKARGSGARMVIAVVPSSGLADKGVILKEGGETYDADLNLVDAAKNHDKFYRGRRSSCRRTSRSAGSPSIGAEAAPQARRR